MFFVIPIRSRGTVQGFTFLELVVVMALVAIVAAIGAPSFTAMIAKNRVRNAGSDLHLSLLRARSEALKRNSAVTVAPKAGGWKNGWTVTWVDPDTASTVTLYDHVQTASVAITGPANVVYQSSGRISASFSPVVINDERLPNVGERRCVAVQLNGMPTIKKAKADGTC